MKLHFGRTGRVRAALGISTALCGMVGFAQMTTATAACAPDPAVSGQAIVCTGTDSDGFTAAPGVINLNFTTVSSALVSRAGTGVALNGGSIVSNLGTIQGLLGAANVIGLSVGGAGNTLQNSGTISALQGVFSTSTINSASGVALRHEAGLASSLVNAGLITVQLSGSAYFQDTRLYGVLVTGPGGGPGWSLQNTGTINVQGAAGFLTGIDGAGSTINNGAAITVRGTSSTNVLNSQLVIGIKSEGGSVTNTGSVTVASNTIPSLGVGRPIYSAGAVGSRTRFLYDLTAGIFAAGTSGSVLNAAGGTITTQHTGILTFGASVENRGTITVNGAFGGAYGAAGISAMGNGIVITNSGTITVSTSAGGIGSGISQLPAIGFGVVAGSAFKSSEAAANPPVGSVQLTNSGVIRALNPSSNQGTLAVPVPVFAIAVQNPAYSVWADSSATMTVVNTGTIDGPIDLSYTAGNSLTNSGLLTTTSTLANFTHRINGTFTQTASGILELRIRPIVNTPDLSDKLVVTGQATLGGTLRIVAQTIYPGVFAGQQYTLITAGSIVNSFGTTDFSSIPVVIGPPLPNFAAIGNLGSNGTEVVAGLSGKVQSGPTAPFLSLSGNSLILNIPSGAVISTVPPSVTAAYLRLGSASTGALATFVAQSDGEIFAASRTDALAAARLEMTVSRQAALQCASVPGSAACNPGSVRVWLAGAYEDSTADADAALGAESADRRHSGVVGGLDYQVSTELSLGASIGAIDGRVRLGGGLQTADTESLLGEVRAVWASGGLRLVGQIGYVQQDADFTRAITAANPAEFAASYSATSWSGRFEAGYRFDLGAAGIGPYGAVTLGSVDIPGFTEQLSSGDGSFGLSSLGASVDGNVFELGVDADVAFTGGALTGRVGWQHVEGVDEGAPLFFTNIPNSGFTSFSSQAGSDQIIFELSLDAELGGPISAFGRVNGAVGDGYDSLGAYGGIRVAM